MCVCVYRYKHNIVNSRIFISNIVCPCYCALATGRIYTTRTYTGRIHACI